MVAYHLIELRCNTTQLYLSIIISLFSFSVFIQEYQINNNVKLRHGCRHKIKAHTDTNPEKPGLASVPDFMMPRILSPNLEQVITKHQIGQLF